MNFFNFVVFLFFFLSFSTIQTLFTRACVCVGVLCVCVGDEGGMEKKVCVRCFGATWPREIEHLSCAQDSFHISISITVLVWHGLFSLAIKSKFFFSLFSFYFAHAFGFVLFSFVSLPSAKQLFRNIRSNRSNRVRSSSADCWRRYIVWISCEYRMYYMERKLDNILASDWNSFWLT